MSSLPVERAFVLEQERRARSSLARPLVSGRLELEFAADSEARTYLRRQYATYPFHVCRAQFQDRDIPGLPTLYLQSCAGGVYEDDRLELVVAMREEAEAHVSTQSASIVHSMIEGRAEQQIQIDCERGAYLEYLPDPQILFPGSRYRSVTRIRLGEAATCLVSEAFLRHDPYGRGEMFSAYGSEIVIETASGKTMAIDRLTIDGASRASRPGILGQYHAQGTLVIACRDCMVSGVGGEFEKIALELSEAIMGFTQLPKSAGVLVRILAADGAALKRTMHATWCAARLVFKGSLPLERRK
jgi:urease accessory protein